MVVNPQALAVGTYMTDGRRLVEVRRVDGASVVCEEGPVGQADVVSLTAAEVAGGWRVVAFDPIPLPDYWLPGRAAEQRRERRVARRA